MFPLCFRMSLLVHFSWVLQLWWLVIFLDTQRPCLCLWRGRAAGVGVGAYWLPSCTCPQGYFLDVYRITVWTKGWEHSRQSPDSSLELQLWRTHRDPAGKGVRQWESERLPSSQKEMSDKEAKPDTTFREDLWNWAYTWWTLVLCAKTRTECLMTLWTSYRINSSFEKEKFSKKEQSHNWLGGLQRFALMTPWLLVQETSFQVRNLML